MFEDNTYSTMQISSNRTFMELKCRGTIKHQIRINGSNRTFMELKLFQVIKPPMVLPVLIVPLWN